MKRKLWMILAFGVLLAVLCCGTAMAAGGVCGGKVYWDLDYLTHELVISGTGDMWTYSSGDAPWYEDRNTIWSVTVEEGVTHITRSAFLNCSNLTSVALPTSLTGIYSYTFANCSRLDSVILPRGVAEIGQAAFSGCKALTNVYIANPECVFFESEDDGGILYSDIFEDCSGALYIHGWDYPSTAWYYSENYGFGFVSLGATSGQCGESVNWSLNTSTGKLIISGSGAMYDWEGGPFSPFYSSPLITSAVVGNGITHIGDNTFYKCTLLSSVTIPQTVKSIGSDAFSYCNSLSAVALPGSVTGIGDGAFYSCKKLTSISIPKGVTEIKASTFQYCSALADITLPDSLTDIGHSAFAGCSSLTCITLPASLRSIIDHAFEGCSCLESVTIPAGVTDIGLAVFESCSDLSAITVAGGNAAYSSSDGVLYNKNKTLLLAFPGGITGSFTIPGSVTEIAGGAFRGCAGLTNVTVPGSVNIIGSYAFYGCCGLTHVNIPQGVAAIGSNTFFDCSSLTGITIPDSVSVIYHSAFQNCAGLTSVSIPASVESIWDGAFRGCTSLISATIHSPYTSIEGLQYDVFKDTADSFILRGHAGSTAEDYSAKAGHSFAVISAEMGTPDFILPQGLTLIDAQAFYGGKMKVVWLPDTVTFLGNQAFASCKDLVQIRIPASVTSIASNLFFGNDKSKITIFGAPGSAAEDFANETGIMFEIE